MGNTKNTFEKKLIMLTLVILSASLIAYAAADHHTKYTCTEWSAIPGETGTGFTATGTANVNQADDMKLTMELKQLVIQKDGADAVGDFIAHVHDGACADGGGGHWKKDYGVAETVAENEVWSTTFTTVAGTPTDDTGPAVAGPVDDKMISIVIHEKVDTESPKRVCCTLAAAEAEAETCKDLAPNKCRFDGTAIFEANAAICGPAVAGPVDDKMISIVIHECTQALTANPTCMELLTGFSACTYCQPCGGDNIKAATKYCKSACDTLKTDCDDVLSKCDARYGAALTASCADSDDDCIAKIASYDLGLSGGNPSGPGGNPSGPSGESSASTAVVAAATAVVAAVATL